MICFTHPAWVHQFHHILWRMQKRGDQVMAFVAEKDGNSLLCQRSSCAATDTATDQYIH